MFITHNQVRLHDMDLAGLLYFPRQFRFVHDAFEDFMAKEGISFEQLFHREEFLFVIVHCEADYSAPMKLGDLLEIHLSCDHIGTTSFSLNYRILRKGGVELGRAKTVHVTLDKKSHTKIAIPQALLKILKKYLIESVS